MDHQIRSRQLNPCDDYFWRSRGYSERPDNWKELLVDMGYYNSDSSESEDDRSDQDYDEDTSASDETSYDDDEEEDEYEREQRDARSNQLNPNNDQYWRVRGYACRPSNWQQILYGR